MLTRSKADQRKRSVPLPCSLGGGWPQGSTAEAGGGPFDLPVLSSAEALGWDRDDSDDVGTDRGFQAPADFAGAPALSMAAEAPALLPLDEAGFHLDTAGRLDYSTPGAASGRGHPYEFLPIQLDPALADPTVAGAPAPAPPSSRAWQIPNYGGGGGGIAPAPPLPGSRRASFDPAPLRRSAAAAAAAAAEEDKRRRNTVASARFRVKKKAREQALETREKDLSVRVGQLRKRIADLEVENKWLRELLLAKKDVGAAADAQSRVLAQLEAALQELREAVSDEDGDGGGGGGDGGGPEARQGGGENARASTAS